MPTHIKTIEEKSGVTPEWLGAIISKTADRDRHDVKTWREAVENFEMRGPLPRPSDWLAQTETAFCNQLAEDAATVECTVWGTTKKDKHPVTLEPLDYE